jgi:hypothetical protein
MPEAHEAHTAASGDVAGLIGNVKIWGSDVSSAELLQALCWLCAISS